MKDASVNAHAAGANLRDDFVHAEAGAGRKGQCLRDYTGAAAARTGLLLQDAVGFRNPVSAGSLSRQIGQHRAN